MADFKLIVKNGSDDDEFKLKSTNTLKDMVHEIKMEYEIDARAYGLFSLQNRFGVEFYNDEAEIDSNSEINETMESLFGNPNEATIIYDPIKAGLSDLFSSKKPIVIWNALKKPVRGSYTYKINNVFQTEQHHKVNIGAVAVAAVGGGGDLGIERTIIQEKNGPDNKSGEFDIAPRAFAEVPFEDKAIKGTVADCTIVCEDGKKIAFSAKKGEAFIIFKAGHTQRNDPPIFVYEKSDYCRNPERFDWKTQTGKDLSNNVERPRRHNKK